MADATRAELAAAGRDALRAEMEAGIGTVLVELYQDGELAASEELPGHTFRSHQTQTWLDDRARGHPWGYRLWITPRGPAGPVDWLTVLVRLMDASGTVLTQEVPVELYTRPWTVPNTFRLPPVHRAPVYVLAWRVKSALLPG